MKKENLILPCGKEQCFFALSSAPMWKECENCEEKIWVKVWIIVPLEDEKEEYYKINKMLKYASHIADKTNVNFTPLKKIYYDTKDPRQVILHTNGRAKDIITFCNLLQKKYEI